MNLDAIKDLRDTLDWAWRDLQKEGEAAMNTLPNKDAFASNEARVGFHTQADKAVKAAAKWMCAAMDLAELCERERR